MKLKKKCIKGFLFFEEVEAYAHMHSRKFQEKSQKRGPVKAGGHKKTFN